MSDELRILILEDVPTDAELAERELRKAGLVFRSQRVDTREGFERALEAFKPDIVLADYKLPNFNGGEAIEIVRRTHPEVPVIIVTGALGDEAAIDLVHQGARDYVLKSSLPRLEFAIRRALSAEQGIRARKAAEREVRLAEEKLRAVFDGARDGIVLADAETKICSLGNPAFCNMLGYSREELARMGVEDLHPQQDLPHVLEQFEKALLGEIQLAENIPVKRKDGSVFYADIKGSVVTFGGRLHLVTIFRDITKRLERETRIRHLNTALRTLSTCNSVMIHARTEDELFRDICRHLVEIGGHLFAGVFFSGAEPEGMPYLVAGFGDETIRQHLVELQHNPEYVLHSVTFAALHTRLTRLYNTASADPQHGLEQFSRLGIESTLALPLISGDHLYGALTVFSSTPQAFDADTVKLMEELAGDIAFGIATQHTRAERDRAVDAETRVIVQLRQSFELTIAAMALTLEKRDPYAAGHQQRVAKLATAIANEMGLPPQQVEGIHFGSLLHNIGTVSVPAEILNRPSKLRDTQFALIKLHPQSGFEIVKDIPFPWPVAQMVLQHHERLDGSGYPQGLKSEQIMLEARILAVADVLEAMRSYRPYRAALSTDAALDALTQGRGIQFDPAVVDACLRVVKNNVE